MNYSKRELDEIITTMRRVAHDTYALFFSAGMGSSCHAFLEFNGLISKYVDICQNCAKAGIDFTVLNQHSSQALPVADHDINYLVEKLDCIFGPAIRANEQTKAAFAKLLEDK